MNAIKTFFYNNFGYKDTTPAKNYHEDLKKHAQKYYPGFILLTLFCWLPYIEIDQGLSLYPQYVIPMRWGLSFTSICCLILFLSSQKLRDTHEWVLKVIFTYVILTVAFITAYSGAQPNYVGGYFICLLCTSIMPINAKLLYLIINLSITTYLTLCFGILKLDFSSIDKSYGLQDLSSTWMCCMIIIYGQNKIRRAMYEKSKSLWQNKTQLEELLNERTEKLKAAQMQLRNSLSEHNKKEKQLSMQQTALTNISSGLKDIHLQEKAQLADHLHDTVGQHLAVSKLKINELLKSGNHHIDLRTELEKISQYVSSAIQDTRSVMNNLNLKILEDLDLKTALTELFDNFQEIHEFKVKSILGTELNQIKNNKIKHLIFRTTQELLINAIKHSGTNLAYVSTSLNNNSICILISDEGNGFDTENIDSKRYGLKSIRERCKECEITFKLESTPGHGSIFSLEIPIKEKQAIA